MNYFSNLLNALDLGSARDMLFRLIAVVVCLCVHEMCHALAAYALGDSTAKSQHRLSLNPFRHIDWLGLAMLAVAGFGWAKPVMVDPRHFKHPKLGMALTALAGPISNMILAFVLLFATKLILSGGSYAHWIISLLISTATLSIGLGIFNMIPIPPLDGSKVLFSVLPDRAYNQLMRYERYGMILLLALVLFGAGGSFLSQATESVLLFFARLTGLNISIQNHFIYLSSF